jgi:hypothetical protein
MSMVVAAMIAVSAQSGAGAPAIRTAQAQAMVRILPSARLRVGADRSEEGIPVRSATVSGADGVRLLAKLVEFE